MDAKRPIKHSRPTLGLSEALSIHAVLLNSGMIAEWEVCSSLEREIAGYLGGAGAVAASTGTLALELALVALDANGGEVIIPSYTCRALLDAVILAGAKPVIVDVDPATHVLSLEQTRRAINRNTRAAVLPHFFGAPIDMAPWKQLGVPLIEDCATSIGTSTSEGRLGSFGDMTILSFYATKMITCGAGGMVVVKSPDLLKKLRNMKRSQSDTYELQRLYPLTDMQASMCLVQWERMVEFIAKRREIALRYYRAFADMPISAPDPETLPGHVFYRYVISVKRESGKFLDFCHEKGVQAERPVGPKALHQWLKLSPANFPVSEEAMATLVSIPIYPSLKDRDETKIKEVVREAAKQL